jgi:MFS family permease
LPDTGRHQDVPSDEDTKYLDDNDDRRELRDRYYGLLQELRVVLPGVQVLLAFLLTAPFAQRFNELDAWGRRAYETALASSMLSVVFLLGPTFLHRFGERTARRDRLLWSIRLTVVGLALLGVSLLTALWGVARFVLGGSSALQLVVPIAATMVAVWVAVPLTLRRRGSTQPARRARESARDRAGRA